MKLIDLKIDTQLRLGFFLIFFLIVFLGVISWSQGNQLAKQTTDLYEHPFTVRTTLGELKADVLYIQHGMDDISRHSTGCAAARDSRFPIINTYAAHLYLCSAFLWLVAFLGWLIKFIPIYFKKA